MDSVYIRELKHYSKDYLVDLLGVEVFGKLSDQSILRFDRDKSQYQFHYVGVILIDEMVINIYPKYIRDTGNIYDDFKQVISVIKCYDSSRDYITYEDIELDEVSSNLLPVMLFFVEDYYENGVYTIIHNIIEENGTGEIDWNRTVNNNLALIRDDKPYYTLLETKYKLNDIYDYFRLLHEYIVTECSVYLESVELLDLFDLTPVDVSDKCLDDFGELDFILGRLRMELNVEFNTHKQKLLQAMISYLSHKNLFNDESSLRVYGTTAFHEVWEKVCKEVLGDKLDKKLSQLHLPCSLSADYNGNDELISVIKKPVWMIKDKAPRPADTFIPDIVTFHDEVFIIFDAKYYYLHFDKVIDGQPGLESITKQYLYELAFKDFIYEHGFNQVFNAFLFPTEKDNVCNMGYVTLEILSNLGLEDIQVIMLPASVVYDYYLRNERMDLSKLKL